MRLTEEDKQALSNMRLFMEIAYNHSTDAKDPTATATSLRCIDTIDRLLEASGEPQGAPFTLVPSPRPENDNRASWRAVIAAALPEGERFDFEAREFVPCYECSRAPGSPALCRGCLANRQTITELREWRDASLSKIVALTKGIEAAAHEAASLESRLTGLIAPPGEKI